MSILQEHSLRIETRLFPHLLFRVAHAEVRGGVIAEGRIADTPLPHPIAPPRVQTQVRICTRVFAHFRTLLLAHPRIGKRLGTTIPIASTDPDWDLALVQHLASLRNEIPEAGELVDALTEARVVARDYELAGAEQRAELLERAESILRAASQRLRIDAVRESHRWDAGACAKLPEDLFVEDATLDAPLHLPEAETRRVVMALDEFLDATVIFDETLAGREALRQLFVRSASASGRMPLLELYEVAAREISASAADRELATEALFARLQRDGVAGDSVALTRDHLQSLRAGVRAVRRDRHASHAARLQFYNEAGQLRALLIGLSSGFGRMAGRFLHLLDERVTRELREWNERVVPDALLAEIPDTSCATASLHPSLLKWELVIPGAPNAGSAERQIFLTDLDVAIATDGELALFHRRNGRRVHPIDLGTQPRTGLAKLLTLFTLGSCSSPQPIVDVVNRLAAHRSADGALVRPRITYENRIVLQRRSVLMDEERAEVLPSAAQMLLVGGRPHATECVVHWYRHAM